LTNERHGLLVEIAIKLAVRKGRAVRGKKPEKG
jgi:hypothetical protein